jgi:pimeloyl-ACP methyl ester carboxylesterase
MEAQGAFRVGSGEPLVMIHGFSGVPGVWRPIVAPLQGSFDILGVALAGHVGGRELPAGTPASVTALVDAVERDMDSCGFETPHVVGNSLGGWIALELARRGRARSVVALAPAGGWEKDSSEEQRLKRLFTRSRRMTGRILPYARPLVARPRLRRMVLAQVVARGDRLSPTAALELIQGSFECPIYLELMEAVERDGPPGSFDGISCPVLLAWGTKDKILPVDRYSSRMRDLLPAARWLELPGLGHVPMADDTELIASTIADFAAKADTVQADTVQADVVQADVVQADVVQTIPA